MNENRKESFRKWATFVVSTLALMVACLRDPIVFTFRGTVHEVLRQEMASREGDPVTRGSREKRSESDAEILKRLDQILIAVRDKSVTSDSGQKLLMEVNGRLVATQARLDLLIREQPRPR